MPVNEQEWASIQNMVEREVARIIGKRMDYFILTRANIVDEENMNIYCDEFGQTPVPMFAWEYEVKYYDSTFSGDVVLKYAKVRVLPPVVGDTVLIAREMGADRLPRCLGVLKSTNFLIDEDQAND
jgi:hypothetical protein